MDTNLTSIDDLKAAPYNPRTITDEAAAGLRASLGDFGDISGITYNERTGQLVSGHQRVQQLKTLGGRLAHDGGLHIEIPATGETYPVRVVDWDVAKERRANIVANNPHIGGSFTADLQGLLEQVQTDIGENRFGDLCLDKLMQSIGDGESDSTTEDDGRYTGKIETPIYEPTQDEPPPIAELYSTTKTDELTEQIDRADLPPDVASFLRHAAMRHTVFRYDYIAEYYAHASPDIQRLMEQSALVIIDFEQAIESGFVRLTQKIAEAYAENKAAHDG